MAVVEKTFCVNKQAKQAKQTPNLGPIRSKTNFINKLRQNPIKNELQ
jgi:hypothetical protein